MKFRYAKFPSDLPSKPWVSRPIIPVRLYGPKDSIPLGALLDSGADRCFFSEEIGRMIGLDIEQGIRSNLTGVEGQRAPAYLHKVRISVDGMPGDVEVLAGFTASKGVGAILGQEGFFDAFKVTFERTRGVVDIAPARTR